MTGFAPDFINSRQCIERDTLRKGRKNDGKKSRSPIVGNHNFSAPIAEQSACWKNTKILAHVSFHRSRSIQPVSNVVTIRYPDKNQCLQGRYNKWFSEVTLLLMFTKCLQLTSWQVSAVVDKLRVQLLLQLADKGQLACDSLHRACWYFFWVFLVVQVDLPRWFLILTRLGPTWCLDWVSLNSWIFLDLDQTCWRRLTWRRRTGVLPAIRQWRQWMPWALIENTKSDWNRLGK